MSLLTGSAPPEVSFGRIVRRRVAAAALIGCLAAGAVYGLDATASAPARGATPTAAVDVGAGEISLVRHNGGGYNPPKASKNKVRKLWGKGDGRFETRRLGKGSITG